MKKILFLFVILIFSSNIFAEYDSETLAGTYQWCPFHCETIKLNKDFTFDYLLDGDLFNNQRTKGVWKFVGENKIYLKSPEKKLVYKVTEERKNKNDDKISVQIFDQTSAVIPGIVLKLNYFGSERQYITNEDGISEIPKTDEFEMIGLQKSADYKIKDSDTNSLTVEIKLNNEPDVDKTFLFKDKRLFTIFEDDAISENWYKKVDQKVAKKLFPDN